MAEDGNTKTGEKKNINVRNAIIGIVKVIASDADLSNVKGDVRLRDQLDIDSMDFLDIVMELRKNYKIEVPKEDYPKLATLDECEKYLTPRFKANPEYKVV